MGRTIQSESPNRTLPRHPHLLISLLLVSLVLISALNNSHPTHATAQNTQHASRITHHASPVTTLRGLESHITPRASHTWHTLYLPFVTRQEPLVPLYRLFLNPADLDWLYRNPYTYETVPAVLIYEDTRYDVQVRFRGGTSRDFPKKSWKIDFPARTPFQGQRELNLNAQYTDKSLLREMLSYDLFERAGLPASRANFARLEINDRYMGLFVQVEQVDQRFLDRIGWDPNGNLYKGDYGNFEESSDYQAYQDSYAKKTNREDSHDDVIALVRMINRTSEADFPAALAKVLDIGEYLDWVAVHILLGDFEWLEKNYYLYHDLQNGGWTFLPWDLDLLLGHNWHWGQPNTLDDDITWDNPIDSGTWWSKKSDGKWNKLITEVLRNEDFKFAYCRRLWELMNDQFAEDVMYRRIDTFYRRVIPYAEADPNKWGTNADFHYGPTELKTYVSNRLGWLTNQIPAYCPPSGPMPHINELMNDNQATLTDEAGEHEPWIELYNPGLVSFDVGGMTLQKALTGTLTLDWRIPPGTVIPPRGFLLIWADGEPGEGPLHAGFRLDGGGHAVILFDKAVHGGQVVDQTHDDPLPADHSLGRLPDGDEAWTTFDAPTPGWSNLGRPPRITGTTHAPAEPGDGQAVTVTALVIDEEAAPTVTLHWVAGGVPQAGPMQDVGGGTYGGNIPALSAGTVVTYYVQAEDVQGLVSTDPPRAPAVTHRYVVGFQRPPLYVNELVAINDGTLDDEQGQSDDWFEIYNAGSTPIDLGGMYLTDAIENSTKWQIPTGLVVPAGGHLLFWADGEPEQGPTHLNFRLDGDGERLALYAGPDNYNELIDEIYYGPQTVDRPWGRYPDGGPDWRYLTPTPGQANRQPPPVVRDLGHSPAHPSADQAVNVVATVMDDGAILSATLHYSAVQGTAGLGWTVRPLRNVNGSFYSAQIPGQAAGVPVEYYIRVEDDEGAQTLYPADAPQVAYGYRVGYVPPPLYINEFLASNDTVNKDEWGEYEDWVELYNAGSEPLDIGGMYLTDDLSQPTKWRIPDGTVIPAGGTAFPSDGFLLIWTDDDEQDGPLHTSFRLSRGGEEIGLFDRDAAANALIDSVVFGPQHTDISAGRWPDGGADWTTFGTPTPGRSNTSPQ